ncbi:MAG: hypothetical protein A2V90_07720 [Gammaproteobacteria bacterium RBG_16_57_12]|nr:MAG: hypothetical protein A2V90_07720 [Gammaproteobacteria bacterium RBG_16_57_12]
MANRSAVKFLSLLGLSTVLLANGAFAAPWDPTSQAANTSLTQSRHNLTQSFSSQETLMDFFRNNYGEVCVYCHTPHGANVTTTNAPLWNHTINTASYTTWNTIAGTSWYPGPGSLICLGCHDGSVAIDSVINMPGSGAYKESNKDGTGDMTFLDNAWTGVGGGHLPLGNCIGCHTGGFGPDFRAFDLGKDLRNDHPVGVNYPATGTANFNIPANEKAGKVKFFGGDSTLNKEDIRLVYSGSSYKVECVSCHDPHGVPSAGTGSVFVGSFLRKDNAASALCLTCHDK